MHSLPVSCLLLLYTWGYVAVTCANIWVYQAQSPGWLSGLAQDHWLLKHVFPKTYNATVLLIYFPWGAKTQKRIQERGAQTGKETVMEWQPVATRKDLPPLENLTVPIILKFFCSSAVNKHLWHVGWFKQNITPAVDVSLSIILSDKQVCKISTYDELCDHSVCDGLCDC